MNGSIHHLTIPSSTHHLYRVRRFVEHHALAAGFSQEAVDQVKIAVDEACANIIEHAYHGESHHEVTIILAVEPDRLIIRIRDRGEAFDLSRYNEPDVIEYSRSRRSGGLGVHIMREFMDEVEYNNKEEFNEVCLTKLRNGQAG